MLCLVTCIEIIEEKLSNIREVIIACYSNSYFMLTTHLNLSHFHMNNTLKHWQERFIAGIFYVSSIETKSIFSMGVNLPIGITIAYKTSSVYTR